MIAKIELDGNNNKILKPLANESKPFLGFSAGMIIPYGGSTAPAGWLICDGAEVSRTIYADLFAVIGTAFGSGDGSTTFNIPDLRESVPKGAGLTGNSNNHMDADGLAVGEFLDDRLQNHRHSIDYAPSGSGTDGFTNITTNVSSKSTGSVTTDSRSGVTTEVKSVGVNYIIKF